MNIFINSNCRFYNSNCIDQKTHLRNTDIIIALAILHIYLIFE